MERQESNYYQLKDRKQDPINLRFEERIIRTLNRGKENYGRRF